MDPVKLEGMDEELKEDYMRQMIYGNAQRGPYGGGEDGGGEDDGSQLLNDSGDGAELELMIDNDEVPLITNSDAVCVKSLLITRCIN